MTKYTCPCCGYKTIPRLDTFYDLCPVCFWETDPIQLADPHYKGGANRPSLAEAQQNFILFGACEKDIYPYVRTPLEDEIKDENWVTFDQNTEGSLFLKKYWNESTGNPKTNHWGMSTYYFETTETGEILKQIEIYANGKVLKYSDLHRIDEFGRLSIGWDLKFAEYDFIDKNAFFALWNVSKMETFAKNKLHFSGWLMPVFKEKTIYPNPTFKEDEKLISATLDHRFALDLSYQKGQEHFARNGFFLLKVDEGQTGIHYFTYMNWDEAVAATQKWIDEVQVANRIVDARKDEEACVYDVRVMVDNQLIMSKLTTWRNMDWDVEKFRNIQIEVRSETYSIINTFTDFENMLLVLQQSLPENYQIETCFFCRFSGYHPVGNDNFGVLDCFKNCKEAYLKAQGKHPLFDLYEKEKNVIFKVEETYYCADFQRVTGSDWAFKNQIKN